MPRVVSKEAELVMHDYMYLVDFHCRRYSGWMRTVGADMEDCRQIGTMALFSAINAYKQQCSFRSFAGIRVMHDLFVYLKKLEFVRYIESVRLDAPINQDEPEGTTVGELLLSSMDDDSILTVLEYLFTLNQDELNVIDMLLRGHKEGAIAKEYKVSIKDIRAIRDGLAGKWRAFNSEIAKQGVEVDEGGG